MSEFFFVGLVVLIPLSVHAGFFTLIFNNQEEKMTPIEKETVSEAFDIPLLTTLQNPNPMNGRGGAEILVDNNVLVSTGPVGEDEIAKQQSSLGEIKVYTVREGDSLSKVAEMFRVTTNTIMWANDLSRATAIQPGDTLIILPIVGVRHEVKKGDTIATIAKKYEGNVEEILAYNEMTSADDLVVGNTLIIPGGEMHKAPTKTTSKAEPTKISGSGGSGSGFSHPAPGSSRSQGIHGYNAVDMAGGLGSSIRAAAAGEVIVSKNSGWNGGYGQYIVIRHSNGTQTLYAHLSSNAVGVGDYVTQGEVIGGMGQTGRSTGVHLHFEVRGASNPF